MNEVAIQHNGLRYSARVRDGDDVTKSAGPSGDCVWDVIHEGATVTSFPVSADDTHASVERKVVEWLDANADRPQQDVGRQ